MSTVAGIFKSREAAERAFANLRSTGIADERISLLAPGTSLEELDSAERVLQQAKFALAALRR